MIGETVTRLRGTVVADAYPGATVLDWDDPDELDIDGCALAPRMDGENHDLGRRGVIIGWTLYTPPGADILPQDRIRARGADHDVDGMPGTWTNPYTGNTPGIEIALRRIEG